MVGDGVSLCRDGGGGVLFFHITILLCSGSASSSVVYSSLKFAVVVPSSASSSHLESCPLAKVEAVESLSEVCNHYDFHSMLGSSCFD
ncbi:hypothetical protein HAX54_013338 [Datura stramonium]|uniref:Secreted protein n=1 Tax=Datura stramonium TaxID=4076 RepID=A0ABS8RY35_DATST|nr:hypothetical protein [Datura stramonium]